MPAPEVDHVPLPPDKEEQLKLARRIAYMLDNEHARLFGKPSSGTLQERCEILLRAGHLVSPAVYWVAHTMAQTYARPA